MLISSPPQLSVACGAAGYVIQYGRGDLNGNKEYNT